MLRVLAALLFLSTLALAQPSPYVVLDAAVGNRLNSPQVSLRDSATADVFWARHDSADTSEYVEHAVVSLTQRQVVAGPEVIQHTDSCLQLVADVISRGAQGWVAVCSEEGMWEFFYSERPQRMTVLGGADHLAATVTVDSGAAENSNCQGWGDGRIRLGNHAGGGWILSWIHYGCHTNGYEMVPANSIGLAWLSPYFEIAASSLCCGQDYEYGPSEQFCVSSDPDTVVMLSCEWYENSFPYAEPTLLRRLTAENAEADPLRLSHPSVYWDLECTRGGGMLALSAPGDVTFPAPHLVELHRDGQITVLDTLPRSYDAVAFHPDYGFALLGVTATSIVLSRVDTSGAEVQATAPLYRCAAGDTIVESDLTLSGDGRVMAVWTERTSGASNAGHLKSMWVDWNTILDAQTSPLIPPSSFTLSASPNPFNSELRIEYVLPRAQNLELAVYNLLGQKVATLENRAMLAGAHSVIWSPQCGTGVYFVTLKTPEAVRVSKVMYLR